MKATHLASELLLALGRAVDHNLPFLSTPLIIVWKAAIIIQRESRWQFRFYLNWVWCSVTDNIDIVSEDGRSWWVAGNRFSSLWGRDTVGYCPCQCLDCGAPFLFVVRGYAECPIEKCWMIKCQQWKHEISVRGWYLLFLSISSLSSFCCKCLDDWSGFTVASCSYNAPISAIALSCFNFLFALTRTCKVLQELVSLANLPLHAC